MKKELVIALFMMLGACSNESDKIDLSKINDSPKEQKEHAVSINIDNNPDKDIQNIALENSILTYKQEKLAAEYQKLIQKGKDCIAKSQNLKGLVNIYATKIMKSEETKAIFINMIFMDKKFDSFKELYLLTIIKNHDGTYVANPTISQTTRVSFGGKTTVQPKKDELYYNDTNHTKITKDIISDFEHYALYNLRNTLLLIKQNGDKLTTIEAINWFYSDHWPAWSKRTDKPLRELTLKAANETQLSDFTKTFTLIKDQK